MAVSSIGVGSGLPLDDLLTNIMKAESQPLTLMAQKEASYQAKLSAYGNLKGALATFQTAMAALGKSSTFENLQTSIADKTIFTATATSKAASGNYQVNVTQMAQAHSISSTGQTSKTALIGSGADTTLTFQFGTIAGGTLTDGIYSGGTTFTQDANQKTGTVVIKNGDNSLQGIRDAVNAANIGVTATLVSDGSATPDHLIFTSNKTGEVSSMKIDVDGDAALQGILAYDPAGTQTLKQTSVAQNTQLTVNGFFVNSPTNEVKEAVQGVTLNVIKTGTTSMTLAKDTAAVEASVNSFVKAYNDLTKTIKNLTGYNADTKVGGLLVGDSTARTIQDQLRNTLSSALSGLSNSNMSLPQIGVAFQKDGTLAVDSVKLKKAMDTNYGDIAGLFATVGKATDSLINFTSSTSATKAGSYDINVTKLATKGSVTGDVDLNAAPTIIAPNTKLSVTIDGVASKIALTEGSYTSAQLAALVQSAINGASEISAAGSKVTATIDSNGFLNLQSDRYGSASKVIVNSDSGTPASALLGTVSTGTDGVDVEGTIGGVVGTGSGQILSAGKGSDAVGLKIEIVGGTLGSRGRIDFSQGYADRLNKLTDQFIGSDGLITGSTDSLNSSIKRITDDADAFKLRLVDIEARYRKQFSALDSMIASMQRTQTYLTQQLASIAANSSSS
ncbi:flagellar filament capping protein FliD [Herminiimonas fonticola]|uniref:Flagellar hook-associated protein 2 n=1 Tax=Herminiimonas fonticola TaxID=303380 RepID=A0A4V3BWJ9_9BURK|nr:flagellar filament capping protein FliD [Herminiimonas fonticola]RBA25810.1 Flagellar hook-associated protein 2 C-terminus [Herminiimonas fonticola]TDN94918.1 flagellar hook-associated protein 2 [Herminiimonas fonticola]